VQAPVAQLTAGKFSLYYLSLSGYIWTLKHGYFAIIVLYHGRTHVIPRLVTHGFLCPLCALQKYARDYPNLAQNTYKKLMDDAKAARPSLYVRWGEITENRQYWALGSFYLAVSDTQNFSSQILVYDQPLIHLAL